MGRSVSYPSNSNTVCFRNVSEFGYGVDDDGNTDYESFDEFIAQEDWNDFVAWIRESAKSTWKSFEDEDKWLDREDHVILENSFAYIGVSEYCGLASIWLKSKHDELEGSYYTDEQARANLCEHWCNQISDKFEKLFGEYKKVGTFSNGESVYLKPEVEEGKVTNIEKKVG